MKHSKYKHWTQAGTLSTLSEFQIDELRKNHSVEIYHRRVMIRKKPNRQLTLSQPTAHRYAMSDFSPRAKKKEKKGWPMWAHRLIQKILIFIAVFEIAMGYVTVQADQLIGVDAKIDLSPVQFTDDEIREMIRRNPDAIVEAKYQHLQDEARKEIQERSGYTDRQFGVVQIIKKYFGKDAEKAIDCFKSESGLRADAINTANRNGTIDRGVAQINSIHCGKVEGDCATALLDAETNIKIAKQLYDRSGFNPWYGKSCRKYWR